VLEILFLAGLGMLAITLHARLKTPLNIPGHHGVEFMMLMVIGRLASRLPVASTISATGIGVLLLFPVFSFNDPLMGFHYTLPGILLDIFYRFLHDKRWMVLLLILAAGAAYMSIPLSRILISMPLGLPYMAVVKHGFIIPPLSFGLFGAIGGMTGYLLFKGFKKLR
jgi:hypothetical protein